MLLVAHEGYRGCVCSRGYCPVSPPSHQWECKHWTLADCTQPRYVVMWTHLKLPFPHPLPLPTCSDFLLENKKKSWKCVSAHRWCSKTYNVYWRTHRSWKFNHQLYPLMWGWNEATVTIAQPHSQPPPLTAAFHTVSSDNCEDWEQG